jgi:thymidylate synthase
MDYKHEDGTPFTKEEFLQKLKTDRDFNSRYGRKHITEGKMVLPPCHTDFQVYTRELSKSERYVHLRTGKYSGKWDGIGDEIEYYNSIGVPKRAISLMWNQRSVDTFLGLPFNIASYGLLLEIIAKAVNMVPDELIGNLGDTHLYLNHIDQAKEQLTREPYPLPTLNINTEFWPTESGECGIGGIDAAAVFHPDNDTLL